MAKFMWTGSYTQSGTKGLIAGGGSARRKVVEKLLESVGGRVESFYFAFGSDDLVLIGEVPDNVTVAAISLTVAASGAANGRVTTLLTADEIDQAVKMSPAYAPPAAS